ncbi:MAG: hypothetical protein F4139_16185 [Gemmatimonadetes bacterium]|nr:hypothetical protein [Gemmatimonadota bacterium]MYA63811.1 hypothetical protein [Gemmatimonadota bacterium]MYB97474.1 hypothetical protein [Gemmatimonadota bacterium]MYH54454.1 hypothetical protein [Gemmatimonadota bacterium]MYI45132.1 hypothetical protein [Gemmatimonadota bacterium]
MTELVKKSIRCGLIGSLALGALAGAVHAQEGEGRAQHIQNVLLTFRLIQADGFTDVDPEISDVVEEIREIFNFQGYRLLSTSVFNVGLIPSSSGRSATGSGLQRIYPSGSETALTLQAEVTSQRATGTVRAKVTLTDATRRHSQGGYSEPLPLLEITVTFRDGQTAVLGSAPRTADGPVLILVVTPKIDP